MRERAELELVGDEANLAVRVRRERTARGWSLAEMARRMDLDPPMPHTAVYRIENGTRTIRVDELIAFTRAFGLQVADLLTPVDLVGQAEAEEIAKAMWGAMRDVHSACQRLGAALVELKALHASNPDAGEYLLRRLAEPIRTARSGDLDPLGEAWSEAADTAIGECYGAVYSDREAHPVMFLWAPGVGAVPDPDASFRQPRGGAGHGER